MEYFFMDKVTAKRLICLGTYDILYLQLSAFLVDNGYLSLIHMFVYNYLYGTVPVRYRYRTV